MTSATATLVPPGRSPNRRGEGRRLRHEIVGAAVSLLEEVGSTDALTLRAVARRVGIAAPSIYPHFAHRGAMVDAVKEQIFRSLVLQLEAADPPGTDPVVALRSGCRAYLRFAFEHPALYAAVFGRSGLTGFDCSWPDGHGRAGAAGSKEETGVATFDVFVDAIRRCTEAGRSTSTDPFGDAVALWVGLHGVATLTVATPAFPWPELEDLLDVLVFRLTRVDA